MIKYIILLSTISFAILTIGLCIYNFSDGFIKDIYIGIVTGVASSYIASVVVEKVVVEE